MRDSISSRAGADLQFDSVDKHVDTLRASMVTESFGNRNTSRMRQYQENGPKTLKRIKLPVETTSKVHAAMISKRTIKGGLNSDVNQKRRSLCSSPVEMLKRIEQIKNTIEDPLTSTTSGFTRARTINLRFEKETLTNQPLSKSFIEAKRFSHIPNIQTNQNESRTTFGNSIWGGRSYILSRDEGPFSTKTKKLSDQHNGHDFLPQTSKSKNQRAGLLKFYQTLS